MKKHNHYSSKKKNLIIVEIKDIFEILLNISNFLKYFLFNNKSINLFICLNNYSYYLAKSYVNENQRSFNLIFYDPERTKIYKKFSNIIFCNYRSIFYRVILLLICFRVNQENIFLPHTNGGLIQKFIARNFNVSILEDGLDSYRESPNNIKISSLVSNQRIIIPAQFKEYNGFWVNSFKKEYIDINPSIVLPIFEEESQSFRVQKKIFEKKNSLTIESPGVDNCFGHEKSNLFLPHPGKAKNFLSLDSTHLILNPYEASYFISNISEYRQNIFVGETMILVYLLKTIDKHPFRNLQIGLKRNSSENLRPLINKFFIHSRINFSIK